MPIEIRMPALSPTMEEGGLSKWLVSEGDKIEPGDVIAEIETDKATMEVEAVDEGTIGKILIEGGTNGVKVNELIALVLEEGEDLSALDNMSGGAPKESAAQAEPAIIKAEPEIIEHESVEAPSAVSSPQSSSRGQASSGARVFASPLARRIAEQNNIDIAALTGSGPHGRIVKSDVERALSSGAAPQQAGAHTPPALSTGDTGPALPIEAYFEPGSYDKIPIDNMRMAISRRLTEAKRDIPHFYIEADCQIDELLALRKKLNERAVDYKISVNDFIVRACALGLRRVPDANACFADTHILRHKHADVSIAVAIDGGLITPIIRNADSKGLAEISLEAADLVARAREMKLAPTEYEGGTFSVSNLGMFGVKKFTAIINPPQAAILAIGSGRSMPIVRDGEIVTATMMTVSLSCDHRVIDGALGAKLLAEIKGLLEEPLTMLL